MFFATFVFSIEEGDSQIFDMQHELTTLFGARANFYSVLEISKKADEREVKRAYNKISLKWHPDKNPSKEAEPFYKIVTSIQEILRNPKKRARYNMYLAKGFPVWRGDNYYSSIWEPSAFTVGLFVLMVISVAQYISLIIFYFQDKQKVAEAQKEIDAKLASKTPAQILKDLKKADINISKKDLKKAGSDPNMSKELLSAAGLIDALPDPVFPSVADLVIVTFPKWIFKSLSSLFSGKKDGVKEVKEE